MAEQFQERISYQGELRPFLISICRDFDLGHYENYRIIPQGYEDFNIELETNTNKAFVKVFAKDRKKEEIERIVSVLESVGHTQIRTPKLYKSSHGYLDRVVMGKTTDMVIVTQYIEGKNLYEGNKALTDTEKREIVYRAALINRLEIQPSEAYDQWAIRNFIKEYRKKHDSLDIESKKLIFPLIDPFQDVNIENLPHSLVHGDLIKTNILKDKEGMLYIVDFSVANYYPRIQELAVLLTSPLFDETNINAYKFTYNLALVEYQKQIQLTETELNLLPLFVRVGHAMHLLNATWEKVHSNNMSEENLYWLNLGKIGLQFTQRMWNDE